MKDNTVMTFAITGLAVSCMIGGAVVGYTIGCEQTTGDYEVKTTSPYVQIVSPVDILPQWEIDRINAAIDRNGTGFMQRGELLKIVCAIRKAENSKPSLAFGIINPKANDYDSQAGWAVCTVHKSFARWQGSDSKIDFITYLAARYCPVGVENDPQGLNKHWLKNVLYFIRLQEKK